MIKLSRRQEKAFTRYCFQDKLIGEGIGRKVYSYSEGSPFVIKIAKNRNGRTQNKTEVERYKLYPDKFAKIYAYSKNIIIMEKVTVIEFHEHNELANWFDETFNCCSEDSCSQGYSRLQQKTVLYDYGFSYKMNLKQIDKDYCIREYVMSHDIKGENKE